MHEDILKIVFENLPSHVTVKLFADMCHAGSMIDVAIKLTSDTNGCYTNGEQKFKSKFDIFAASQAEKLGYGNLMEESLEEAKNICESNENLVESNL